MKNDGERLRVELFGNVKTAQSAALNYQLQGHLKCFDEQYEIQGGRIGSLGHQRDRMEFARIASESLIDCALNLGDRIGELESTTKYHCTGIPVKITVTTQTKFGDDISPASSMPFYEPN
jgi:hypothetical protein